MCGFAGFCGEMPQRERALSHMMQRIVHRGPDDSGVYFDQKVALGFRRLSILDLRTVGNQPMQSADGLVCLVFNGEIYNYLSLRAELQSKGHHFHTKGDTEVLLHGYLEYGQDILFRLRGMFAFAIWDKRCERLFCGRDFFGIKPFYYHLSDNGTLLFSSEAKAILAHPAYQKRLNEQALCSYLTFQHSATEQTFFAGIYRLPPAHTLCYQDGTLTVCPYATPSFCADSLSEQMHVTQLQQRLSESVALHRQSDVEVGAFLSGGVDSGYLVSLLRPKHTFSVGFAEQAHFDEIPQAAELAQKLGVCHHHRYLTAQECFDSLGAMQYHLDEPHSNPSVMPLWFLAQHASQYVKVVLSGEGADELFGGYDSYTDTPWVRRYKHLPPWIRHAVAKGASLFPYFRGQGALLRSDSCLAQHYVGQAWIFSTTQARQILRYPYSDAPDATQLTAPYYARYRTQSELCQKQLLDLHFWLPNDILQKADKMSMAASLELRVPYLDREVFSLACRLRDTEKVNSHYTKAVLRYAARDFVGDEVAFRQKKGFPVPIRLWLRQAPFFCRVADAFSSQIADTFFDRAQLLSLLSEHKEGRANHARKIWCIYTFLVWYTQFFEKELSL